MKLSFLRSTAVAGVMAVCMTPLALQSAQAAPSTIPYPADSATSSSSAPPGPSASSIQGSATTTPSSTSSFGEEADGDDTAVASSSTTSPASSPTSSTSTTATSDASASSLPSSSSGADDSQNFLVGVDEAFANTVDATKFDVLLASGTASNDTSTAGDSNSSASSVKTAAKKASAPAAKTATKTTARPSVPATTAATAPAATAVPTITGNSIPIPSSVTTTAAAPAPTTTTTIPVSSSGPKTLALTTPALRCEVVSGDSHLAPWVARVRTRITAQFGITDIGGYRNDPGAQDHATGHALDVMLPSIGSPLGDEIATWVLHNYKSLNVKYVIYRQHIWAPYRQYWRQMEDRGDPTQNHFDHVHISFLDGSGSCPTN